MDRIPEKFDSKFRYVLLASERAHQLMQGARPKAEHAPAKSTRIGMNEVAQGLVEWDYGPAPAQDPETDEEVVGATEVTES